MRTVREGPRGHRRGGRDEYREFHATREAKGRKREEALVSKPETLSDSTCGDDRGGRKPRRFTSDSFGLPLFAVAESDAVRIVTGRQRWNFVARNTIVRDERRNDSVASILNH